ncbi:hypothetical protein MMC28_002132 [Mycoblastus sanguinarius]|nr:hypothetical protein [Mycoblastus sanguinarius]
MFLRRGYGARSSREAIARHEAYGPVEGVTVNEAHFTGQGADVQKPLASRRKTRILSGNRRSSRTLNSRQTLKQLQDPYHKPTAMAHNAWTNNGQGGKQHAPWGPEEPPIPPFNAQEVRDCLKSGFRSVTSGDGKALAYKPTGGQANSARSGGAWTSNAKNMSNGKEFFLELRKQVTTLQQGGERAGG